MPAFVYQEPFPLGADDTRYRLLTADHVSLSTVGGREVLSVQPEGLVMLAQHAMRELSFLLRTEHLQQVAAILDDPEASANDRNVALALLRNAEIASNFVLPLCQDTGTAIIIGKKGEQVWTGANDKEQLSHGVYNAYTNENLRYSQTMPLTMYSETNSGTNLPAQIDLYTTEGTAYNFLFLAKGGGSANKSYLFQETKAVLNPDTLVNFLTKKMMTLGTAACPPYHLAFVIGGTSAEDVLKTVKLASTHYLDGLPTTGNDTGQAFRDLELEQQLLEAANRCGIGAQFGGKYFALDVRAIRLPRHGASCPIGMGLSCSAHRNLKAKINAEGLWLEQLESNPGRFIPDRYREVDEDDAVKINLDRPIKDVLADLSQYPVATNLSLTGTIIVARDLAHARIKERIDAGDGMPNYFKNHPIYYAGPAKTPEGMVSGSFGPTTAGRMDSYVDLFQSHGGSMIMLAKGNRSQQVTDACEKHGGFYLGSIGGPAALLASKNITKIEVLEYPELGMEAIYRIEVVNFPAFILIDDKGNDFFQGLSGPD